MHPRLETLLQLVAAAFACGLSFALGVRIALPPLPSQAPVAAFSGEAQTRVAGIGSGVGSGLGSGVGSGSGVGAGAAAGTRRGVLGLSTPATGPTGPLGSAAGMCTGGDAVGGMCGAGGGCGQAGGCCGMMRSAGQDGEAGTAELDRVERQMDAFGQGASPAGATAGCCCMGQRRTAAGR